MTMDIDDLIDGVIDREGGFVDHPADRGGATNWGITQAVARAEGYAGAMRGLPRGTAAAIYAHRHTVAYRLDRVRELTGLDPLKSEDRERLGLGLKAGRVIAPGR